MTNETLTAILASNWFARFDISDAERDRIADKARDIGDSHGVADERDIIAGRAFIRIWENEDWWLDASNS